MKPNVKVLKYFLFPMIECLLNPQHRRPRWYTSGPNSLLTKKEAEASFDTVVSDYSTNSASASTFAAFGAFATGAGFSSLTTGAVTTAVGAPSPTIRLSSVV